MIRRVWRVGASVIVTTAMACTPAAPPAPTAAQATTLLAEANATMLRLGIESSQANWVYSTFITSETEAILARADRAYIEAVARYAAEAAKFDGVLLPADERRQLDLIKNALEMVTPADPAQAEELTRLSASLESAYGRARWCRDETKPDTCADVEKTTEIMATSRNEATLRDAWTGWHAIGAPMRRDYQRFVELSNTGAKELGFADTGAMWRLKYDMPAEAFTAELDRLWEQVRPLYVSLHAYVRLKLRQKYGSVVPAAGPIPAHLLGNIWAQDWTNIFDLVWTGEAGRRLSLDTVLRQRRTSPTDMVRIGEQFFSSLGFAPLPPTFWERSLFVKPADRDVVCHASAWDIDAADDLRIKMCIDPTAEDFYTIHHELGHIYYQRAYKDQRPVFRAGANQAFHEAIGDAIALSITPEYLVKIGVMARVPDSAGDLAPLMQRALDTVAFLPFGLLIDQWRWDVYGSRIPPADYNRTWWDLRLKYQGVAPPSARGEQFFDPGAKYHVPANYSYARYFLAAILQFQFHREFARQAGCTLPLHRCSIYGNLDVGTRLSAMLAMGQSKSWPDALEQLIGTRKMDATAMIEYFAPLKVWLDEQTKGQPTGW